MINIIGITLLVIILLSIIYLIIAVIISEKRNKIKINFVEERRTKRCDQLFALGLKYNGVDYVLDDFNVHWTEITCETEKSWNKIIDNIQTEMERRKNW